MAKSIFFISLMMFTSCDYNKNHFTVLLNPVDTVKIQQYHKNDTASFFISDKRGLNVFKNIVNGLTEKISINRETGRILYYSKGKLILDVAIFDNLVIRYSNNERTYKERISYQAGMYFDFYNQQHEVIYHK
jgi:hypothetical protein